MPKYYSTFQPSQKSMNKQDVLNKKMYYMTRLPLDNAGQQTDAEGSLQEASSGRSMYYNESPHPRTIPVSFGSPSYMLDNEFHQ
jgi:hypothetical protein